MKTLLTTLLASAAIFTLSSWMAPDPLAEKYPSTSPYAYCLNNPVSFVDPQGDSVAISGAEQAAAYQQLQQRLGGQLNMSMSSNGTITATPQQGVQLSAEATQALAAFNSSTVTVNVNAANTTMTSTGNMYVGGAFMGNTVTNNNGTVTVVANQEVNPQVLGRLSNANGVPGQDMLHEVTEAYQGGVTSQRSGVSSPNSSNPNSVYNQAHSSAVSQSGSVVQTIYDRNGNVLPQIGPNAVRAEYSTFDRNGNRVIIMTFP